MSCLWALAGVVLAMLPWKMSPTVAASLRCASVLLFVVAIITGGAGVIVTA
jgi:hypothetical protein